MSDTSSESRSCTWRCMFVCLFLFCFCCCCCCCFFVTVLFSLYISVVYFITKYVDTHFAKSSSSKCIFGPFSDLSQRSFPWISNYCPKMGVSCQIATKKKKILLDDFSKVTLFTKFITCWNVNTLEYVDIKLPPQSSKTVPTVDR